MRLSKNNQLLLFSAIGAVTTAFALSRNFLQTNPQKLLEKSVEEAVQKWKNRLYLTTDQTEPMRKTLMEFAHKKNDILKLKISRDGKKERLQELQLLENEEVRKFLTDSQYEQYIILISEKAK